MVKANLGEVWPLGMTRDGAYYYQQGTFMQDVYVADVEPASGKVAGQPTRVSGRYVNYSPIWSPDGEYLVYHLQRDARQRVPVIELGIRSLKTGEERVLSTRPALQLTRRRPQWLPDGSALIVGVRGDTLR